MSSRTDGVGATELPASEDDSAEGGAREDCCGHDRLGCVASGVGG